MATPAFHVHLSFDGTCSQALRFYEQVLGAKVLYSQTYGKSPMGKDMPPGGESRIIHSRFLLHGQEIMAADAPPGRTPAPASRFTLSLSYPTAAETQRVFAALTEGGTVTMPLQKTFFSESFGMGADRFGVPWMVLVRAELPG
jgi:PhnB protein